jgi:maleate isomerase
MSPTRIGMLVPSSNVTMETELPQMLLARRAVIPDEVFTFHSARMRMTHVSPEQLASMNAQTSRAAQEIADAQPDAVVTACLVAIMAQGPGYHCTAESEIVDAWPNRQAAPPVVSSAGALLAALEALGARSVAMVTPYVPSLTQLVGDYIEDAGYKVCDSVSLGVADNLEVARLDPSDLPQHVKRLDLSGADVLILSACVQMPSFPAIETVERLVDIPVVTAASATCFQMLRALDRRSEIPGGGYLLSGALDAS